MQTPYHMLAAYVYKQHHDVGMGTGLFIVTTSHVYNDMPNTEWNRLIPRIRLIKSRVGHQFSDAMCIRKQLLTT